MAFEHLEVWRGDPAGEAWLRELPGLLASCVDRWSLRVGDPWTNSVASLTMPAFRGDERLVLKFQFPDRESVAEAAALERWDGGGAVRLLDHDPDRRALLLERCDPGSPLSTIDPERALDVVIGLVPRLWVPGGPPFRPLADEVADLTRELAAHDEGAGRRADPRLIDAALEAFEALVPSQGEQVLVNQDLHADNVLRARREPWLVIDPKPLSGEREFGAAAIVRGSELGHSRDAVVRRLDRVSAELGLDRERVRLWTIAHTVAWSFSAGPLPGLEAAAWLLEGP